MADLNMTIEERMDDRTRDELAKLPCSFHHCDQRGTAMAIIPDFPAEPVPREIPVGYEMEMLERTFILCPIHAVTIELLSEIAKDKGAEFVLLMAVLCDDAFALDAVEHFIGKETADEVREVLA